jgi:hypothetical protein
MLAQQQLEEIDAEVSLAILRQRVSENGLAKTARELQMDPSYMRRMLARKVPPSSKLLSILGNKNC